MSAVDRCPSWCVSESDNGEWVTHKSEPIVLTLHDRRRVSGWLELFDHSPERQEVYVQLNGTAGLNAIEDITIDDAQGIKAILNKLIEIASPEATS